VISDVAEAKPVTKDTIAAAAVGNGAAAKIADDSMLNANDFIPKLGNEPYDLSPNVM
jgi:hypothetical protein